MKQADPYTPKPCDLHGLNGISDSTIDMPMKLYDGYVREMKRFTHVSLICCVTLDGLLKNGGFVSNDSFS